MHQPDVMAGVLIPLTRRDFDPLEEAVSCCILHADSHHVVFVIPDGHPDHADNLILDGNYLSVR